MYCYDMKAVLDSHYSMEIDLSDEEFVLPQQGVNFALTLPESEPRQVASVSVAASDKGEHACCSGDTHVKVLLVLTGWLVCRPWNS